MKIPVAQPDLTGNELNYVSQAITEGWISSSGRFLDQFENEFAKFCGTKHAIAACNGTVVLHLLLLAMGVGPGDEVIVPSFTYVASANAVTYTGARPIFVDSELEYWNLDPNKLEAAITSKTKAIMAVHLYGHPADMLKINAIAQKYNIPVIEDAAEAHGAEINNSRVGGLSLAATFSFYGNKIITTGEGGMITTNDDQLAAKIRQLRGQGMDPQRRYWFPIVGYNYRMTNVAAALGCAQMERASELIAGRVNIAQIYNKFLKPVSRDLNIHLPSEAPWAKSVYWLYCIRVPAHLRDPLMAHLASIGVETRPFFPPMHHLPMYADVSYSQGRSLPVAEELGSTGINLPTWNALTEDKIKLVCDGIIAFMKS